MGSYVVEADPMIPTFWSQSTEDKTLNTTPETSGDFCNTYM